MTQKQKKSVHIKNVRVFNVHNSVQLLQFWVAISETP